MNLIIELPRRTISEIKLKRTDTTLDLSQKAKRAKEERLVYQEERMSKYLGAGTGQ